MNWEAMLDQTLWINIAIVIGATLVSYLVLQTILKVVTNRLQKLGKSSKSGFAGMIAEMLSRTSQLLLITMSLLIGLKFAELPLRWESAMSHGWFIALAFQMALWLDIAVHLWMDSLTRDGKARNPVTTTIIGIMLRIVVWTMMLLSILANLGVDITAMVASLGVGGIAIALAVQTLLSDVFASLSIGIDKPFEIGDFVVFGDIAGNIEHIGLKTTRIRSLSGEQVVCANADLLAQTIHNYKRMNTRRIVFKFGISYKTPASKLREISQLLRTIIDEIEMAKFDRAHFFAFDNSQLTYEVVYIMQTADYNAYMDVQQEINLRLLEGVHELEVDFAHPIRQVEFIGGNLPEMLVSQVQQEQPTTPQGASPAS